MSSNSGCPPKPIPPCGPRVEKRPPPPLPSCPQDEPEDDTPKRERCVEIWHPGFDARFPHTNMTRRCWQNFVDFYRCQSRLGEDDARCEYYRKAFIHLCPEFWVEKWEDQRENGTFPASLD